MTIMKRIKKRIKMNDPEYISIKEFAKRAGVSRQSVYKALNQVDSRLTAFVNLVDNQKMLNIKAAQVLQTTAEKNYLS